MSAAYKLLAFGLPVLLLTAGCFRKECEIKCVDGFKITTADECDESVTLSLATDHGGSCSSEEQVDWWW
jgi:hypothetical protein